MKNNIPEKSIAFTLLPVGYSDVFTYKTESKKLISTDDIMVNFWLNQPGWVRTLTNIRNFLVRFVGLKGSESAPTKEALEKLIREGGTNELASIYKKSGCETILLLQDKHLDAYISVYVEKNDGYQMVYAMTLVKFHRKLGHVYFFFIKPFHKLIVKRLIKGAVVKAINR